MSLKTKLYLGGALALVLIGAYAGRKYSQAGGASGIAFDVAGTLWNSAVGAASAAGGSLLDAMPSSQVPAVVDMAGPKPDISMAQYESLLMGFGN